MPERIPPSWLDCSFYVYESASEANLGSKYGGSGCLVGVPSKHDGWIHFYAVTNRHIIDRGFGVLRLNTTDGKMSTIETQWPDWETLEESGDVAVMSITLGPNFLHRVILVDEFVAREILIDHDIWPGDEVFMIGRLVNQAGKERNTPVVRFGSISMLSNPDEPIATKEYGNQEGFLVECKSLSGFSGSPVFLTSHQQRNNAPLPARRKYAGNEVIELLNIEEPRVDEANSGPRNRLLYWKGTFGPWFLGIDWGHIELWKPVVDVNGEPTKHMVEQNTGIACVVPAWKIIDILNKDVFVEQRKADDAEIARDNENATSSDFK